MTVYGTDGDNQSASQHNSEEPRVLAAQPSERTLDASDGSDIYKQLVEQAGQAAQKSYSPYSQFPVGAALLTKDGRLFTGCNVENAAYGGTICAERTAIVKAVSEGYTQFKIIAVSCLKVKDAWPCGACRQFISEFGADIEIASEDANGGITVVKIAELLPRMFGPGVLGLAI